MRFKISVPFKFHRMEGRPTLENLSMVTDVESSKEELLKFHRMMTTIRRVEVMCDGEYKSRKIRGYLHLYDGQEAIAVGTEAALTRDDSWITSYRCHAAALVRGCTPAEVFGELFGRRMGTSRGKGGSMHMYKRETNFFGGAGIVGAQVPVGAGLAFSHKYQTKSDDNIRSDNAAVTFYGDGAANQGQCWETANMAFLWKLPLIMVIENNQYGMGTSTARSSALTDYYKQGGEVIPGIQVNGMDALGVKACMLAAKEYVTSGNGPIFVEALCYRYHGHSISDPGITYRSREEVSKIRASRDPLDLVKKQLIDARWATEDELKEIEREIKKETQDALVAATSADLPEQHEMFKDMYANGEVDTASKRHRLQSYIPPRVRMPDLVKTYNA